MHYGYIKSQSEEKSIESNGLCGTNSPCYDTMQNVLKDCGPCHAKIKVGQGHFTDPWIIQRRVIVEIGWDQDFTSLDQSFPAILGSGFIP
jgi:hypothetical protein